MPRNSSGTYTLPAGNPVVPNTLIETTWANPTLGDVASALTDSLDRFGRGGMLAPMRFVDGTVTAPSMAFSSETTLGLFRPSSGTLAIAVGGVARWTLTAALLTIQPPVLFQGAVTFSAGATITGPVTVDKLYNQASPQTIGGVAPDWQMAGTSAIASSFGAARFGASAPGPNVQLGHSRGAAVGTQTILVSGDELGQLTFTGSDGVSFQEGAVIVAEVDGTPGAGDLPTRLRFMVSADGSVVPAEALRLSQNLAAAFAGPVTIPNGAVGAPALNFASSLTTGFYRIGADILGIAIAGVEKWRIDASGRLVAGGAAVTTRVSTSAATPILQVYGTTTATASMGAFVFENTAAGASSYHFLGRGRGTPTVPLIVASGDSLGRISVAGYDGANFTEAARIIFAVDGTPGANDMPGRIEFMTTPDGASTPVLAATIDKDGALTTAGTARFNGTTYGSLGIRESGAYGGAGPNATVDGIVLESSTNTGISILTPNTVLGQIRFGDPENNACGGVIYDHTADTLRLVSGAPAVSVVFMTDSAMTLQSGIEGILADVGPTSTLTMGYRGLPQNSRSAAYTLVLTDAGKHIYHPSADTTARTWTIPANASVAYPIGTALTFVNDTSAGVITIAITSDTLVLAGPGSTGSRSLAANGVATAVKVTATRWMISGTNIT